MHRVLPVLEGASDLAEAYVEVSLKWNFMLILIWKLLDLEGGGKEG